jgi:hypothetical protein
MKNFHKMALKHIQWWAWAAVVLPLTALAGMFFVEFIGTDTQYKLALATGATVMFGIAVVWWWWALYIIAKVTGILAKTIDRFDDVDTDIKEIRKDLKEEIKQLFK